MCALCWFTCILGVVCSAGVAQGLAICGNVGPNFASCYTCHAREKIRRRWHLPPTFGLPPGLDDCCTHFWCLYCASHQELRELVVRGLDGPGVSPLDVQPSSWKHVPGFEAEMAHRRNKLLMLRDQGDLFLPFEQRLTRDFGGLRRDLKKRREARHLRHKSSHIDPNIPVADLLPCHACHGQPTPQDSVMTEPPEQMEMNRGPVVRLGDGSHLELVPDHVLLEGLDTAPRRPLIGSGLQRSWSVAY